MWIIPKNLKLSVSARDMVESKEDLQSLESHLELSLMWRSKLSLFKTWLIRWKRAGWTRHLFGRMLKPSRWKNFEDRLISSPGDSPVNHLVEQVEGEQTAIPDIYFHISNGLSPLLSPRMSSWKMLMESPVRDSKEMSGQIPKEPQFCCMSLENWKDWVTKSRQGATQRRKWVLPIDGKGGLSWGTPRVTTNGGSPSPQCTGNGSRLEDQAVENWPTITQQFDMKRSGPNAGKGIYLLGKVLQWPTPTVVEAGKISCCPNYGQVGLSNHPEIVGNVERVKSVKSRKDVGLCPRVQSSGDGNQPEQFPTPRVSDAEGGKIQTELTEKGFRSYRKSSNQWFGAKLRDAVEMDVKDKLNPNWVEQLQGLPVGWTQIRTELIDSDCLVTESSPSRQLGLGLIYGSSCIPELHCKQLSLFE